MVASFANAAASVAVPPRLRRARGRQCCDLPRDAEELFRANRSASLQLIRFASAATSVLFDPVFEVPQLRTHHAAEHFRTAVLTGGPGEHDRVPLPRQPHRSLLRETPVDPGWMGTLVAGDSLPALVGLDLAGVTNLGPRLACVFPQANHRRFVRLNLNSHPVPLERTERLARRPLHTGNRGVAARVAPASELVRRSGKHQPRLDTSVEPVAAA